MRDFIGHQIMIKIKKLLKENNEKYGKALYFMPYLSSISFDGLIDSSITNEIDDDDFIMVIKKTLTDNIIFCLTGRELNYHEGQEISLIHDSNFNEQPAKIVYIFSLKDYESTETRLQIEHELSELGILLDKEYPLKKIV